MWKGPQIYPQDLVFRWFFNPIIPKFIKPNHITMVRFILTPLVVWLIVKENFSWGIPLYIFTAFTDMLDGSMARVREEVTEWGKIYDPLADKLLIGSLVFIIVLRYLSFYLAFAIIAIEAVLIIGGWLKHKRGLVIQAEIWGKLKMFCQFFGILFLLFGLLFQMQSLSSISAGTLYLAVIFAIVSLFSQGI
ncbi:MAG: CDP-alcohol phosphatidyltransferase family protein [Patescibacteria group bacterium]|nr:CDP-alcohol phosphatidyltransferase family protein [Patescibacteria group bacterium]MDD5490725.1 CDP-alcohol phosphatidyltransferase family protein [Patescibacteria group bacterium]